MAADQFMESTLAELRGLGWRVAGHHEFNLRGEVHTSWLFVHECNMCIKAVGVLQSEQLVLQVALGDAKNHECRRSEKAT